MRPTLTRLVATLLLCLFATACATAKGADRAPAPSASTSTSAPAERSSSANTSPDDAPAGPGAASKVGGYVLAVPENVIWIPWKMVGGAIKGASDGVQAGFDKGRMPALGLLFSPINLVTGFVSGFFEGMFMPPALVGPSDNFGRVMASPTKRSMNVWWYP